MKTDDFKFWRNEIVALFKKEDGLIYYSGFHNRSKTQARGKLLNKRNNVIRALKYMDKSFKVNTSQSSSCEQSDNDEDDANLPENEQELILEMKMVDLDSDFSEIEKKWSETFEIRIKKMDLNIYQ